MSSKVHENKGFGNLESQGLCLGILKQPLTSCVILGDLLEVPKALLSRP